MISAANLVALGLTEARASTWAPLLDAAAAKFQINTSARAAAFTAQCRVESNDFANLTESMYYDDPARILAIFPREVATLADAKLLVQNPEGLAQAVYSNRMGNGNASSGDGWRFIGRGIAQLTGRADYMTAAVALLRPYAAQPELVAQPPDAALTAAWFFQSRGCNALADKHDWDGITLAFNGKAMLQAQRRAALSDAGLNLNWSTPA